MTNFENLKLRVLARIAKTTKAVREPISFTRYFIVVGSYCIAKMTDSFPLKLNLSPTIFPINKAPMGD